jgi:hypothetical protein
MLPCFLLLLALLCAAATCWAFAEAPRLYGDAAPPIPPAPPVPKDAFIDGTNLAEALYDAELRLGGDVEAAADELGPPVLPVTGTDDVDLGMQARLQAQEKYEPAQGPLVVETRARALAQKVMDESVAAAEPLPPKLQPLDDLLPARVWQPVYSGCAPFFVESNCNAYKPDPRLFVNSEGLEELFYARTLQQGQVNLIEPLRGRQTLLQLQTEGVRSKKDPYTRASMTNDVAFGTCESLQKQTPRFFTF